MAKGNLRLVLLYEDDERFVEFDPGLLIQLIDAAGYNGREIYEYLVKQIEQATFTK